MWKRFLIRILIRFIDGKLYGISGVQEKAINQWLADSWQHPGFRGYMKLRSKKIVQHLAGGVGMTELGREDYIRGIGQRFENLNLGSRAQKAFKDGERKRKMANKEIERRKKREGKKSE